MLNYTVKASRVSPDFFKELVGLTYTYKGKLNYLGDKITIKEEFKR